MAGQIEIRAGLKWLASAVVAFVAIYILSSYVHDSRAYPLVQKRVLMDELNLLSAPDTSVQIGGVDFIDRQTFFYATKQYSSTEPVNSITKFYLENFKQHGWRYLATRVDRDHASQFCKGGILGVLGFTNDSEGATNYEVTLTAGGTAIRTCN